MFTSYCFSKRNGLNMHANCFVRLVDVCNSQPKNADQCWQSVNRDESEAFVSYIGNNPYKHHVPAAVEANTNGFAPIPVVGAEAPCKKHCPP